MIEKRRPPIATITRTRHLSADAITRTGRLSSGPWVPLFRYVPSPVGYWVWKQGERCKYEAVVVTTELNGGKTLGTVEERFRDEMFERAGQSDTEG